MGFAEASQILSDFGPYENQDEDMDLDDQMNGDAVTVHEPTHDETQRDSMGTPPIREVTIDGGRLRHVNVFYDRSPEVMQM